MEEFKTENVERVLNEIGQDVVTDLRAKMRQKNSKGYDKIATGELYRTLRTTTEKNGDTYELDLHHQPYFKYVEYDTRPHYPPKDPILRWVRDKKIPTRENTGNKDFPTEGTVTYFVQQKIGREGTEGTRFLRTIQLENFNKWKKEVEIAQMLDVKNFIEQPDMKLLLKIE